VTYRKKLIEVALPLAELNDASAYDKMPGIGPHPKGIHQWWARLPLPTARAVLFASLVDDPSSDPVFVGKTEAEQGVERERLFDIIRDLLSKKPHLRPEVFRAARTEIERCCEGRVPPVLDPFCGGGSIPLEAQRLGLRAIASDLNPVAVLVTKALVEIAPKFNNRAPVNSAARAKHITTTWHGAQGLAEDVRYYGEWMRAEAENRMGRLYPKVIVTAEMAKGRPDLKQYVGKGLSVIAWLWARTVPSPNPAAKGAEVPLVRSFWLSTKDGKEAWVEPVVDRGHNCYEFHVRLGRPQVGFDPAKGTVSRAGGRCLLHDTPIPFKHIRDEGKAGRMSARLMAIVAEGRHGRVYLSPISDHEQVAHSVQPKHFPDTAIPPRALGFRVQLYGMDKHYKLFTHRQLIELTTLSDLARESRARVLAAAKTDTELPDDDRPLAEGGAGPSAYADAIETYLALAVDRCADFGNGLTRWVPSNEKVMNLFGRQTIQMVWDFAEANPLCASVGAWKTCSDYVAACIETAIAGVGCTANVQQLDAQAAVSKQSDLLASTDPPYYDNIGYADLSDFFYIWLRRSLPDVWPSVFGTVLTPKEPELVATPYRTGGDVEKAKDEFETGFRSAFTLIKSRLDPRFPMTVYYAFKQSEEEDDSDEGNQPSSGWETMLEALLSVGFQITATWPIWASQKWRMRAMDSNALASYIVVACRSRGDGAPLATHGEFSSRLRKELPDALAKLQQGNIAPVDFAQAAIGPGMAVFSRYSKVVRADGGAMSVRTALQIINLELDAYLAEQEGDLDRDTRFCVAWFSQRGMDEGEFGQADVLARAMNTAVNGLVEAGVVRAKTGKVKLLGRDELPEDWDPASDTRLTVWEGTQQLIRALEEGGEKSAAALAAKLGAGKSEEARALAYRLYAICERKKWAKEALEYNSLVVAWPEIVKLAASRRPAEQERLF